MKRKKLKAIGAAAVTLCLAMGLAMGTNADSRKVVTLGANLSEEQKQMVMNYFGVTEDEVDILTITNQDERDHLGAYVPLEQIGTRTYSCALVCPTRSGGIQVKTANLDWVTCNMIATTLSTSGVVNCDVIAASPITVSGTGALTGIIMAYEQASGEELDPAKKEIATEELVITGQLADTVGQNEATAIVNEAKTTIISQNITDVTVIQDVVNEAASENNAQLSQEQVDMVTELLDKISQEDYSYDDMKDTLERVDENVTVVENPVEMENQGAAEDAAAEQAAQEVQEQATEEQNPTEVDLSAEQAADEEAAALQAAQESILNNTNDDAFGEDVIMGSTLEPETTAGEPVETEAPAENLTEAPVTEAPVETEAPIETEAPATELPMETEAPAETEKTYTIEDLTEKNVMTYKMINWYLDRVFDFAPEYSESQEFEEINAMEVTILEADPEKTFELKEKFDKFVLKLLAEGPSEEDAVLDEIDEAEYGVPEVKLLYNEFCEYIMTDETQLFAEVELEVKTKVCDEAKAFFKKLYGVEEEETEEFPDMEETLPEDAFQDEGIPEGSEEGSLEG